MANVLDNGLSLGEAVLAGGGLGTAAYGIIDVSKSFWGGVSRVGYGHIARTLAPFAPALDLAAGKERWRDMLFSHWLNGRPTDEQKALAKSLVRLGLSPETAPQMAGAGHVAADRLTDVAGKLAKGGDLDEEDMNILGRFDASLDFELDSAFERADQQYRATAKGLAALVAVVLAVAVTFFLPDVPRDAYGFATGDTIPLAFLIGILAVPLAPVAKDLASGLSAAVKAVQATRRA